MALEIPLDKRETNYTFDVSLDGTVYTFRVYWNVRSGNYFFDLLRATDSAVVLRSARVAVGTAPLVRVTGDARPAGELFVLDTSEKDTDPELYELGDRVQMLYFSRAEIAAL